LIPTANKADFDCAFTENVVCSGRSHPAKLKPEFLLSRQQARDSRKPRCEFIPRADSRHLLKHGVADSHDSEQLKNGRSTSPQIDAAACWRLAKTVCSGCAGRESSGRNQNAVGLSRRRAAPAKTNSAEIEAASGDKGSSWHRTW